MTTKFKLRITYRCGTPRKPWNVVRSFIWQSKEDALTCKALLEKAAVPKFTDIEFVEFTEEIPL